MLMEHCAVCPPSLKARCNDPALISCVGCPVKARGVVRCVGIPHKYCNTVWHNCVYKNDIVDDLMGLIR